MAGGAWRPDLLAGLTVWAVLVPESLAYATVAGLPPVVGLYAAVPALLVYALLGTSRHLVVGPMSATAALSAGIALTHGDGTAAGTLAVALTLALVMGALGFVAGACRLGFLAAFISEPVLKGFVVGLALTILVGQVPALVGVEKADGGFLARVAGLARSLGDLDAATAVVGLSALAVVLVLRRTAPRVPSSLVVVVLGVAAALLLALEDHGVAVVGAIEPGLPGPALPSTDPRDYLDLLGPAAGVLLVGFVEGLAAGSTYAARDGYRVDPDRELTALGGANLGAGLLGGMVVNGSLSKTAVNAAAGARSQRSGVTAAGLTVVTLLALTPLFEPLPEAVLAAVVITAVVDLVDVAALRRLWAAGAASTATAARADFAGAVAALVGVLLLDTLPGLLVGVGVSLVLLLSRASRPHLVPLVRLPGGTWADAGRHPSLEEPAGALVLRVEGPLSFANAAHVRDGVRGLSEQRGDPPLVVLDARSVATIDVTAAAMLDRLAEDLARAGVGLRVAGDLGQVRDTALGAGHGHGLLGRYPDPDAALR
ncbi:SulP family inorganic anion transporter [Nocardioides bruguierae]|uniref:SulP family inorganic anion transporter n=1 Tax=Nocardioides bruguierae TaxID=2945102 RepID=A0A9X2D503_9ACTN|nr:SulP family inorganic anion transporter [Nocardioides bruguierae]MCM0619481.1 SulP family inorganic anion transporter [Nocardioides bruguierae]